VQEIKARSQGMPQKIGDHAMILVCIKR
jgi:hypothetical protein